MSAFGLSEPLLATYALTVVRLSAALLVLPMFGATGVPPHTKIGLALFVGLIVAPLQGVVDVSPGMASLVLAAAGEALVGVAIGFAVLLVYQGMELAGSLIGVQLGLGLGEVLDPLTGASSDALRRFFAVLAVLIFFLINAHHEVLRGLVGSFTLVPLTTLDAETLSLPALVALSAGLFATAVRIALPVLGAVLVADVALALLGRTMPQLNVLVVGLPVKLAVGFVVLMGSLPATARAMEFAFGGLFSNIAALLQPAGS